jgi:hypothetical protein
VNAFIVGFNEWVLKGRVAGQGWKRSKSKDANGWEHDGQIIRELKVPEAPGRHERAELPADRGQARASRRLHALVGHDQRPQGSEATQDPDR